MERKQMTKREFYKVLKENRLFSTFMIICFTSFHKAKNPRETLNNYLEVVSIPDASIDAENYVKRLTEVKRSCRNRLDKAILL